MKTAPLQPGAVVRAGCLAVMVGGLTSLGSPDLEATTTPATLRIGSAGADSEGRQTFQLDWDAVPDTTYRVQVSSDLASWKTLDVITPDSALGSYRVTPSIAGMVIDKGLFARLVLPQPEITCVEPAVVDVTVPNTPLYIVGQCLPSSGVLVVINGVSFAPTIVNSDGVWATVLLNGLPPGTAWLNVSVVDSSTGDPIATLPNSFLPVDSSSPYLEELPALPSAAPVAQGVGDQYKLKAGFIYATQPIPPDKIGGGNVGINELLPDTVLKENGNIAAVLNGNVLIGDSRRPPGAVAQAGGLGVIPFSGEVRLEDVDLAVPGRGLHFIWARNYRSRARQGASIGSCWTHSYDLNIQPVGGDILIHSGDGRADRFYLQSNGTYTSPGFFREGTLTSGVFRLTFADTGYWEFNALGTAPSAGKIARIVDRNGNEMTFAYDTAGRLTTITDTLGRAFTVAYDTAGRLLSVTDFTGRAVTYQYYSGTAADPGGSAGDLKSVTSPSVTGTPNGNDFPAGKTTTYTYSTGFVDDRENHLLLAVKDAAGTTVREHIYQHNQTDLDFLRCISVKRWTDTATMLTYLPQTPSAANQFATLRCIINDPAGNVTECFYDARNRCVKTQEFTGRSTPGVAVTATTNRPANKLRATDPDFFETRVEWNNDSLCSRVYLAGGQQIQCLYESDFDKATAARKRGDRRLVREIASFPVDLNADGVPESTERAWRLDTDARFGTVERLGMRMKFTKGLERLREAAVPALPGHGQLYDAIGMLGVVFGAGLGRTDATGIDARTTFPTSITDPRGNTTEGTFDPNGNLTRITCPVIPIVSPGAGPPRVDLVYNTHGQVTSITHPEDANGRRRLDTFEYHTSPAQSGLIRIRDIDSAPGDGLHITTEFEYDARGNVTRIVDPRGNDWLLDWNALDQCVRVRTPVNLTARCATDFFYDVNDNLVQTSTEVRDAADALTGSKVDTAVFDPLHRVTRTDLAVDATHTLAREFDYDGNDQCVLERGPAAVSGADVHQTIAFEYDERGLLHRRVRAGGSTVQSTDEFDYTAGLKLGVANNGVERPGRASLYFYDGFDRPSVVQDPMGNQTELAFDANDNLRRVRRLGQLNDVPGTTGNARLAESRYEYNALNWCVRSRDAFFNPATQAVIGDGERTTNIAFASCGQYSSVTDDLGRVTTFGYDTAWRQVSVTSPGAKTVLVCFKDAAGNTTSATQTDQPDLGGPAQSFTRTFVFDSLNRMTSTSDNVGNTSSRLYDSLSRVVRTTDPRGVKSFFTHDLLGRETLAVLDLDGSGAPSANDRSSTSYWVDADPRWPGVYTDSHGNTTTRSVDSLGRATQITQADGTHRTFVWDARSDLVGEQDANGTLTVRTFDLNGRCTQSSHTPGPGVATTTTFEQFAHDGLSRLVSATNNASVVTQEYDSLGNTSGNHADGWQLLSAHDSLGNRTAVTYPGGTALTFARDVLNRCTSITEGGTTLASFSHAGPGRVARIDLRNGTRVQCLYSGLVGVPNAPGDLGWGAVKSIEHTKTAGAARVSFACYRDGAGNTSSRAVTFPVPTPHTETTVLGYDNASRLVNSVTTSSSATLGFASYTLDRMGNRVSINRPFCAGNYTMDAALAGPLDFQMNQYTTTPCDVRAYDENGNLISVGAGPLNVTTYAFDCHDRLVSVTINGSLAATYAYDALGRRVLKTVSSGTLPPVTTRFLYDGGRVIEERDGGGALLSLFHGWDSDDGTGPVLVTGMQRAGQLYFLHADDLGNVLAVTNATGAAVEHCRHDDYGAVTFLAADGTPTSATSSAIGNPYCWRGMRLDAETGLQNNDAGGYFDTQTGRYIMRAGIPLRTDPSLGYSKRRNGGRNQNWDFGGGHSISGMAGNPWSPPRGPASDPSPLGLHLQNNPAFTENKAQGTMPDNDRGTFMRTALPTKFQNGDIPNQDDFADLIDSMIHQNDDRDFTPRAKVPRAVLKEYFEKGDKPTQPQFGALIDSMLNFVDDRDFIGLREYNPVSASGFCPGGGRVRPKAGY